MEEKLLRKDEIKLIVNGARNMALVYSEDVVKEKDEYLKKFARKNRDYYSEIANYYEIILCTKMIKNGVANILNGVEPSKDNKVWELI